MMENAVRGEKIDFTNYLKNKPLESDPDRIEAMERAVLLALRDRNVYGHVTCDCYADGRVKVSVDGEYYGIFDSNICKFFGGYVGDRNGTS